MNQPGRHIGILVLMATIHSATGLVDAAAGPGCCALCGCHAPARKVCRLVREEKTAEVVCWGCKSEDFCVPGPSKPRGRHCEVVCGSCSFAQDSHGVVVQPKRFVWTDWIPGFAQVYTRKKLMTKVDRVAVSSYKWVVEDLCPECVASWKPPQVAPGEAVPAPPGDVPILSFDFSPAVNVPVAEASPGQRR